MGDDYAFSPVVGNSYENLLASISTVKNSVPHKEHLLLEKHLVGGEENEWQTQDKDDFHTHYIVHMGYSFEHYM